MPVKEKLRKRRSGTLTVSGKGQIVLALDGRPAALKLDIINDLTQLPSCAPAARNIVTGDLTDFAVVILWDVETECEVAWTVTRYKDF